MNVIYLDFDGVRHPYEVYQKEGGPPFVDKELCGNPEAELFMWDNNLCYVLDKFQDVRIILSTSWVEVKDFNYAKETLPESLQKRVIGATFHSQMKYSPYDNSFRLLGRFQQIHMDVHRRQISNWLAIDDDVCDWPKDKEQHLIATHPLKGLGDAQTLIQLEERLQGWYVQDN